MYSIDDIDVFIITHNRSGFLEEFITSVINQTLRPHTITVLDNESVDDTEDVVKKYKNYGFKHIKTFTKDGNFLKAQELCSKTYSVLLHDDNLIHPQFFERIVEELNNNENVSGITTAYTVFDTPADKTKLAINSDMYTYLPPLKKTKKVISSRFEFAINNIYAESIPFPPFSPCTPALIYRTSLLKKRVDMRPYYGKADDVSLYMSICELGNFVLLTDRNSVFIRNHEHRDLLNRDTGLTIDQFLNFIQLYTKKMALFSPIYIDFFEMIYRIYPVLTSDKTLQQYSTHDFIMLLFKKNFLPSCAKKVYYHFNSLEKIETYKRVREMKPKKLKVYQKILNVHNEYETFYKNKVLNFLFFKIRIKQEVLFPRLDGEGK